MIGDLSSIMRRAAFDLQVVEFGLLKIREALIIGRINTAERKWLAGARRREEYRLTKISKGIQLCSEMTHRDEPCCNRATAKGLCFQHFDSLFGHRPIWKWDAERSFNQCSRCDKIWSHGGPEDYATSRSVCPKIVLSDRAKQILKVHPGS